MGRRGSQRVAGRSVSCAPFLSRFVSLDLTCQEARVYWKFSIVGFARTFNRIANHSLSDTTRNAERLLGRTFATSMELNGGGRRMTRFELVGGTSAKFWSIVACHTAVGCARTCVLGCVNF